MKHLKELRIKQGYTQSDIAKILGISRAAYTNIENGKREPDFDTLNKLSDIFNVPSDYLLSRNSDGWDVLSFPPIYSDAYNLIVTVLLNSAHIFGFKEIESELRSVTPSPERLIEIAPLCRYDSESFKRLISDCIEKSNHNLDTVITLSPQLQALADALDQLNEDGQEKLLDYAADLVACGRYAKARISALGQKNMAAARSGDRIEVASVSAEEEDAVLPAPSDNSDV